MPFDIQNLSLCNGFQGMLLYKNGISCLIIYIARASMLVYIELTPQPRCYYLHLGWHGRALLAGQCRV